jgi:C4-dicarboxylate transporter DctM subunit
MAKDLFDVFGSYNLTVIPLFILMGQISFHAGISSRLFKVAYKFIGHWPGGMAIATIGACTGFSAICGSTNATAATMAAVTLPEMRKYRLQGHPGRRCGGRRRQPGHSGAAQRGLHHLRHHDRAVHRQAVHGRHRTGHPAGRLFILAIVIWVTLPRRWHPGGREADLRSRMASLSGLIETLLLFLPGHGRALPGILHPDRSRGGGGHGIAPDRPASGATSPVKGFIQSLFETTRISCMILVIVAGATIFGHFLAITRIPFDIAEWVTGFNLPSYLIMAMIIMVYLVGGCFIDALALIMLTVPIFYPVVVSMGYDPSGSASSSSWSPRSGSSHRRWASMSMWSAGWPGHPPASDLQGCHPHAHRSGCRGGC